MRRTLIFPGVFSYVAWLCAGAAGAFADESPAYYISMRALAAESQPSFVTVERAATQTRTVAIAGCDGLAYYATAADAQTVASARAAGEVVQLHRSAAGGAPQTSAIVCVIDGSGST